MEKKTFYKWVLIEDGYIVNHGIEKAPVEIDVEHIFPDLDYCGDRNLSEMQTFANTYLPLKDHHYTFKYKEIKVDFSDLHKEEN